MIVHLFFVFAHFALTMQCIRIILYLLVALPLFAFLKLAWLFLHSHRFGSV